MCPPAPDYIGLDVSDEQVISFLDGFKIGALLPKNVLDDINPYQFQPSNLPDGFWYIMHSNMNKENDFGFWKVKEEAFEVFRNSSITGWRRTLKFFEFVDYPERKTDWMMQEYSLTQKRRCGTEKEKELKTMCRIFRSTATPRPNYNEDQHPKSIAPRMDSNFGEVSTSGSLMKPTTTAIVDGTSEDNKLVDPQQRDICILDGDFLELDDLGDPLSHSSSSESSDNSRCSSRSFDKYFDPVALLQEIEDDSNNQVHQRKDSSSKCRLTASMGSFEVVMQPDPSRPLVCDTVKHQPSGCKQTSSVIETKFLKESLGNHSIEKLKVEQREEDPLPSSRSAFASSSAVATPTPAPIKKKEEEEAAAAAVVNSKGLKKYFCFLPF